jgi:hypothetical protein
MVVVKVIGTSVIVMEKPCWGEGPVASVTFTKKVYVPATVGVPEIVPVAAAKVSPDGKEPLVTAQIVGGVIGAATRVAV